MLKKKKPPGNPGGLACNRKCCSKKKEKKRALDIIMRKYSGTGDHLYDEKKVDAITVIRVDIGDMS